MKFVCKILCIFVLCCLISGNIFSDSAKIKIPVLMYHNFSEGSFGDYTISAESFEDHIKALCEAGYTAVTFEDLIEYVSADKSLPEKCVIITSDDGYSSVLDTALPILEKYGMRMSVAVIGDFIGRAEDMPHFALNEVLERDTEKRLELISHSYGMHCLSDKNNGAVCENMDYEEYSAAFSEDCKTMSRLGGESFPMLGRVFVYPFGSYSDETEAVLFDEGYAVTVTTEYGIAEISDISDLRLIKRIPAEWFRTGEDLMKALKN